MSAVAVLRDYANKHPKEASVILGGLACFAAAAIVATFATSYQSSIPIIAYLLGIGVLLSVITNIISDQIIMLVLKWFVTLLAMAWIIVFIISATRPEDARLACLAKIWSPCRTTADQTAATYAPSLPAIPPLPTKDVPANVNPKNYQVVFKFAGFARQRVKAVMTQLASDGWAVQDVDEGGQRTGAAAEVSEVRYGVDRDAEAAKTLARLLQSSGLNQKSIVAVKTQGIAPGTLEAWVSLR